MTRYLAWTVCTGQRGLKLAQSWLSTLRRFGQWNQDVVILGDKTALALHQQDPSVVIFDLEEKAVSRGMNLSDRKFATNCKPFIDEYLHLTTYDYLFYSDIDVLFTKPVAPIIEPHHINRRIAVQKDIITVGSRHPAAAGNLLSAEESHAWQDVAICAGLVGIPTSEVGLSLLNAWKLANIHAKYLKGDQPRLITLLLRHYPTAWSYFEDTTIVRPPVPSPLPQTVLHFSGGEATQDSLLHAYYQQHLAQQRP